MIDPASVIGLGFAVDALVHLVPEDAMPEVPVRLETLTSKQFIRPTVAEADFYRFGHSVIKDSAYRSLSSGPARAPRTVRRLGRADQPRARPRDRVRGDPRLPPRAGLSISGRARLGHGSDQCRRTPRCAEARERRQAGIRPRRRVSRSEPARPWRQCAARRRRRTDPAAARTQRGAHRARYLRACAASARRGRGRQ